MTTDRELLEAAAKAAGIEGKFFASDNPIHQGIYQARGEYYWNPLISDSEALRLAVKLHIGVLYHDNSPPELGLQRECAFATNGAGRWFAESNPADPLAATRRAIVRAAAAIGGLTT